MAIYSADAITPKYAGNIQTLTRIATFDGSYIAASHHPYAVIDDTEDLRSLARQKCDEMWQPLSNKEENKNQYPEVSRIYVSAFMGAYQDKVEELGQEDAEKKAAASREKAQRQETERQKMEDKRGVGVEVKTHSMLSDGILYVIEFFDPDRMTKAVSFGVSVKDDGVVELQEI